MSQTTIASLSSWARSSAVALVCCGATLALLACGNANQTDAAPTAPGGVRKACEARKPWQHAIRHDCTECKAKSTTPKCTTCNIKPYAGVCADQAKAQRAEKTCDDMELCTIKCKGDCDCVDKCFEGKAACEKLTGVVDDCVNKACESSCN